MILLSSYEKVIVQECLDAIVYGPFFSDDEVVTLIGCGRKYINDISKDSAEDNRQEILDIIVNSLNNLTGYPHGKNKYWSNYISVSQESIINILDKINKNNHM